MAVDERTAARTGTDDDVIALSHDNYGHAAGEAGHHPPEVIAARSA
jgi:maltose-binding protein MalE